MTTTQTTMSDKTNLESFLESLCKMPSPEERVKSALVFMRDSISSKEKAPDFRGFWEVRKNILPIFKDIVMETRKELWSEFVELTRDGRRLKDLVDEESAFAIEQIEIAIGAIENDVTGYHQESETVFSKAAEVIFPMPSKTLEERMEFYLNSQRCLNLLNAFASQINSLRKEIIQTPMRAKQKNKLFERLSTLGDQVFPPRRELIQAISEAFVSDVKGFVGYYFSPENFVFDRVKRKVFFFREEIKALQAIAKVLSLNTEAFTATREMLSQSWDKLKGMEKELKREFAEQKVKSTENTAQVQEKLKEIEKNFVEAASSVTATDQAIDQVSRWMREIELTSFDVRALKDELKRIRDLVDVKRAEEESERKRREEEIEKKKQEELDQLKAKFVLLKGKIESEPIATLEDELKKIREEMGTFSLSKWAKQLLEKEMKEIRDLIEDKREKMILTLPDNEREALQSLNQLLKQKREKRQEIKTQVEEYRKIIGGSSLDFEKGIEYSQLINEEKSRLEKVDEAISEIEKKIREIKTKRN